MQYVVCSKKGFWNINTGWVLRIQDSDILLEDEKQLYINNPKLLPSDVDIKFIERDKLTEFFDFELSLEIAKAVVHSDSKVFEAFSEKYLHTGITYNEDGQFENLEEALTIDEAIRCVQSDINMADMEVLCQLSVEYLEYDSCNILDDESFYAVKTE
jgi:hypothetical protein